MPRRHPSSSPLLSPPVLIILLPIITFLFLFCTIPPFLSLTSQILRPTISVKKSWDSLNVFLVVFAILCGIFAKRNDDGSPAEEDPIQNASDQLNNSIAANNTTNTAEAEVLLPQQWFGFSERPPETNGGRLRRSSSSYPDLRQLGQQSSWESGDHSKSQFRFFDDLEINNTTYHRTPPPVSRQSRSREYSDVIKEIPVDTFVLRSSPPPPPQSPAPPPPPPPPLRHQNPRRAYETVRRRDHKKEKVPNTNNVIVNEAQQFEQVRSPPPTPPPPPPPRPAASPSPMRIRPEHKRRKSNVKKEIAMVWASVLSNQRKRKKKQKPTSTIDIYDTATHSPPEQGMSKAKKVHSVSNPPAPPPPPPRSTLRKQKSWSAIFPPAPSTPPPQPPQTPSPRRASAASGRPPLPTKTNSYLSEENVNSGCQSPLIPGAPPLPPFKMPEMKFYVRGDFVKIQSAQSSRCGSPELEDVDATPGKEEESESKSQSESQSRVNVMDGRDGGGSGGPSVFCPSPDVNTKADNFIARLRDEWRLEKMNSMREKKKMA
ncbi:ras-associated and pleckstrin homology domains-containing protein 1 [Prunus yedoensis var. nudiflora]|uniref:Ras-associated and pleckstrin homology domains-containing protein 1 n=1 Tax=Prunus yedoensis var. nudiflora TaxID=2094558 RepID=A0A314YRC7_PRUYE|nr:ras-associated and pleckstrin homology domains-containing protein 1 [Prunus yedoensis var. nudiflora]